MNKVILMGWLTANPEVRYTEGEEPTAVARYTLGVNRKGKDQGSDFIRCVAFGKQGEFAERYLAKGTKIAVTGRMRTGSYTNRDGLKVYTTDVVVEEHEFAESKGDAQAAGQSRPEPASCGEGFMDIPDGIDEELPFK